MHAALVANADKTSEPFRLFVNDEDILGNAPSGGVPLESLEWEYAGSNSPATMSFEHWDPPRAFSISGRARVRFWSLADDDLFQGNLVGRESDPAFATGRTVGMRATDASVAALDRNIVTRCSFPAGLTDKDIIQGLCGQFARGSDFTWLDAEGATEYIGITNVAMPAMATCGPTRSVGAPFQFTAPLR